MRPEILPPALREHWDQVRQGVRRPAAEAARSVLFAATDPSLAGQTGLVIDPDCSASATLAAALSPGLTVAVNALTERALRVAH
jgi:hypothetical protein